MTERIKANYYVNARLFNADMLRIFKNCRFYNHPETEYYKCANNLEKYYINKMRELGLLESKWIMIVSCFFMNSWEQKQLSSPVGMVGKKNKCWYWYTFKYLEFVGHSINVAKLYICL